MLTSLLVAAWWVQGAVSVPFRLADDAIIVDCSVNGRKVSLLFDTGFSGSVVLDSNINVGKPDGEMLLQDFVGTFSAKTVPVQTLLVGTEKMPGTGLKAVLQPMATMSTSYGMHVDGILGLEPFKTVSFEINFEKSEFRFFPKTDSLAKRKPDGKKTFLTNLLPLGKNSLEMEVTTPQGKSLTMALDTGNAFYATTHRDVLETAGAWDPKAEPKYPGLSLVASGPVESFYKVMKDMRIFGVPVSRSIWSVISLPSSDAEGDGTIGFGFLQNFNITVDLQHRLVWFDNFTSKVDSGSVADVGLTCRFDEKLKRLVVIHVTRDSPSALAGLKEGDHLLAIDGSDVGAISPRQISKKMTGPEGSKISLVLSRNGNLMRHELTRHQLLNE